MSAEALNRDQLRAIKAGEQVPGTPAPLNRQQRRELTRHEQKARIIYGGQRWKCTNVQCGVVPPNSGPGIPEALMAQNGPGRSIPLCPVCAEKIMPMLMRLIPALAPFDPDSADSFEEQINKIKEDKMAESERRYQDLVARGEAPAGDDMQPPAEPPSTAERAEAAGLAIAR